MHINLDQRKILWMAGEITLARRRIREALHLMQTQEDKAFFESCYRFEKEEFKKFAHLYLFESPEFLEAIRSGDHDSIAEALSFLEADPYCFRSGYIKKKLCSALKQAPLERDERNKVRELVLKALCTQRPVSFKDYVSLGCRFYTPGFRVKAEKMKIIPFKYIILRKRLLVKRLEEEGAKRSKLPQHAAEKFPLHHAPSSGSTAPALPLFSYIAQAFRRILRFQFR